MKLTAHQISILIGLLIKERNSTQRALEKSAGLDETRASDREFRVQLLIKMLNYFRAQYMLVATEESCK